MKFKDFLFMMIRSYFIILGVLIVVLAVTNTGSDAALSIDTLYTAMFFVMLSELTILILYSPNEISERQMIVRKIIQFVALEAILLTAANVMDLASGFLHNVLFFFEILLIYVIVMFVNWLNDKKTAGAINAKLLDRKRQEEEEE